VNTENEVVKLLTEIRDNQERQLEAHRKSQQDYFDFYNAMQLRQHRRALIAAMVVGIGVALILFAFLSK
jgi:hypothetical protein